MPSDTKSVTTTAAVAHKAAPGASEKLGVLSWTVSNHHEAEAASCVLLSGTDIIAGPCYIPPGATVPVPFGKSDEKYKGSAKAIGVECAAARALNFQQLNSSNAGPVVSTVVFEINRV